MTGFAEHAHQVHVHTRRSSSPLTCSVLEQAEEESSSEDGDEAKAETPVEEPATNKDEASEGGDAVDGEDKELPDTMDEGNDEGQDAAPEKVVTPPLVNGKDHTTSEEESESKEEEPKPHTPFALYDVVQAKYEGLKMWYPGRIMKCNPDGTFDIEYGYVDVLEADPYLWCSQLL